MRTLKTKRLTFMKKNNEDVDDNPIVNLVNKIVEEKAALMKRNNA